MVLRKPYAFLIKNFKLIHAIMALVMIYVVYRITNLFIYFDNLSKDPLFGRVLASEYVSVLMFVAIVVIMVIALIVYFLMRFKKKPKLLYIISIVGYVFVFVILWKCFADLKILEFESLGQRDIRLTRDMILMTLIYQYLMIIIVLIRACGFDIKKFNFAEDIEQLDIEVSDNEEFELTVGIDTNKIMRKARRKKRQFKYVVLENKFLFITLGTITTLVLSFTIFITVFVYNKVYEMEQTFRTSYHTMKIENCYVTDKSYNGVKIAVNDTTFVIVDLEIKSVYYDQSFNTDNMRLIIDGVQYFPVKQNYFDFFDIGIGYFDQEISSTEHKDYVLVYSIPNSEKNKDMLLRYTDQIIYKSSGLEAKYKKVDLRPVYLDNIELIDTKRMPESLSMNNDFLDDSSIIIDNYAIENRFIYSYNYCVNEVCNTHNDYVSANTMTTTPRTILQIQTNLDLKKNIVGIKKPSDFISKLATVKYIVDNKEYTNTLVDKTPDNYVGNNVYLEVDSSIKNASKIWIEITVRNKRYQYILKEDIVS